MNRDARMSGKGDSLVLTKSLDEDILSPNYWAERGKELIDNDYAQLQKIDEVCAALGISSSYFRDVFYTAFGITPKSYLIQLKIRKAMELLDSGSDKIVDVAIKVGFTERNTFRTTFKKLTGVTPTVYRKKSEPGENNPRK